MRQYSQHLKTKVHYFHGELPPIIRRSTKECQTLLSFFFLHLCLAAFRKNIYKTRNRRSAQRLSEALEKVSVTYVELGLLHVDQGLSKLMKSRLVNYGLSVMATLCFPLQRTQKNLIDVTAHTWKKRPFIDNNLINEFLISFTKMFSADVDLSIFLQGNP